MTRSTVVVASSDYAERVGRGDFDELVLPHFHCFGDAAGILAELYVLLSREQPDFWKQKPQAKLLYSESTGTRTVTIWTCPAHVVDCYASVTEQHAAAAAALCAEPDKLIRFPRPAGFYEQLLLNVSRLARIAVAEKKELLLRTEFCGG